MPFPVRHFPAVRSWHRNGTSRLLCAATALFLLLTPPAAVLAEKAADRFFLVGDGRIHIKNVRNGKEADVLLIAPDGTVDETGFDRIDELFGFPTRAKGEHISPRLIFMLDYFSDKFAPGRTIVLESGYRSPDYNANLRNAGGNVAKTSQHMDGMALDFSIPGVSGRTMWETIKSMNCAGVGHYGGSTIHLDAARPRFWEAATSKTKTEESDFNRFIHVSTDYDRYRPGDTVRLSFSSVSDFGFGIRPTAAFVADPDGVDVRATAPFPRQNDSDCNRIGDRKTSRFLYLALPPNLDRGRYRIKIDFCDRPSEKMPERILSNEIELLGKAP
ncbi:MAG: DUF882 domain-containing protein [Syntrophobacteraceae bacterium]|nr:DUF882 domain-containing protein [Desulfobacteraceae bacterium]